MDMELLKAHLSEHSTADLKTLYDLMVCKLSETDEVADNKTSDKTDESGEESHNENQKCREAALFIKLELNRRVVEAIKDIDDLNS